MASAFTNGRAPALDLGRFAAALAVVSFHYFYEIPAEHGSGVATSPAAYGYLGVEFFFMLSGFVIAKTAQGRDRVDFAAARFSRLMPAFAICLCLTSLALAALGQHVSLARFLANLTFKPQLFGQDYADPVYWSLTVELIFYGAVLLFLAGDRFRARARIFTVAWLALSLFEPLVPSQVASALNLSWAPYFAVGIFAYLRQAEDRISDRPLYWLAVAMAGIKAALYTRPELSPYVAGGAVLALGVALPFLATIHASNARLCAVAKWLGLVSYPLYLLHYEFGDAIATFSPLAGFVCVAAASLAVAAVEEPIQRRIRHAVRLLRGRGRDFLPIAPPTSASGAPAPQAGLSASAVSVADQVQIVCNPSVPGRQHASVKLARSRRLRPQFHRRRV